MTNIREFDELAVIASKKTKERDYWMNKLSGELVKSRFPYDYKVTKVPNYKEGTVEFQIPCEVFTKIIGTSSDSNYKLHIVLTSLLSVFLSLYSNSNDIFIGTPIYNKDIEAEFTNTTLVLRNQINLTAPFKEILIGVRENILDSVENQGYPIEVLLSKLNLSFDEYDFPLFDVAIMLEGIQQKSYIYNMIKPAMFFQFSRTDQCIRCVLEYNSICYKVTTIQRIADNFTHFTNEALKDIGSSLSLINVITDNERQQILYEFNNFKQDYDSAKSLIDLFEEQVKRMHDAVAVYYEGDSITYQDLDRKTNQLARVLSNKGVRLNDVVGLKVERSVEMIIGIISILKAGGAYLPINPSLPKERIKYMLADSKVSVLLTQYCFMNNMYEECQLIDLKDSSLYCGSGESFDGVCNVDGLAYVIYTSGTTGTPKGVMIEHRNVINLVYGLEDRIYRYYDKGLKVCLLADYVFDASVQQIFATLLLGHSLYIVPKDVIIDGCELIRFYKKHNIDISDGTPSHIRIMVESVKDDNLELGVKHFIIGGEVLTKSILEKFYSKFKLSYTKVTNVYGPTECCVDSISYCISKENLLSYDDIPIGKPMQNIEIYILNKERNIQPIGVYGELCIGGYGVSRGYLGNKELTSEKFISNPFVQGERLYLSGDIARWLADGNIEFKGRIDGQVKIRGYRIELGEIENNLLNLRSYNKVETKLNYEEDNLANETNRIYCSNCLLTSADPKVHFDNNGVCNVCNDYNHIKEHVLKYFSNISEFQILTKTLKNKDSKYDCLLLYSGGKDSSYVLYKLVEMGLKVLTFTFDNGFISEAAFRNIKAMTSKLNVDNITLKEENMNNIFVESLKTDSTVCTGCFRALTILGSKVAIDNQINLVITGLSRGQILDTKLNGFIQQGIFDVDHIDENLRLFVEMYHSSDDVISKLLNVDINKDSLAQIIFIDYFRYDDISVNKVKEYLQTKDKYWCQPEDTGFCSTNCLINDVGIFVHLKNKGFHNYSSPLSWSCRLGQSNREEEIKSLNYEFDLHKIENILSEIGYSIDEEKSKEFDFSGAIVVDREDEFGSKYLCAYIETMDNIDINKIRGALSRHLPDYMIPLYFVKVEKFPLNESGKIDRRLLPSPQKSITVNEIYSAPRNEFENKLVKIWSEVLNIEQGKIGISDKFFNLGGDSFKIIQLNNKLNEAFQMSIPVAIMFKYTTIRSFADYLSNQQICITDSFESTYDDNALDVLEQTIQILQEE